MPFPTTPRSRLLRVGLVTAAALCALSIIATGCRSSTTAGTTETTVGPSLTSQTTVDASSLETSSSSTDAELFDSSVVHEITVSFAQEDYDAMIGTYEASGEKDWIEATVVIDGETYEDVGMRLKGNSSIMSLRGGGMGNMGPMGGNRPTQTTETSTTETVEAPAADGAGITSTTQAGAPQRDTWQGFPGAAGGPGGSVSADAPEGLPWLIDLDKNVDRQNHEGVVEFCVRSNGMETALNEAVSLELLEEAGLASQEASAVRFRVNGSEAVLRLVIENPDDLWMAANFDISGALYKAESTGDYSYRGDDPDSYDEVFDQEAGKDNADLTPLVEFLDFINNSDDATFKTELPDRLDIDSFATYLALEDLIANSDDINGAGNNSYLYYDTKAAKFTVVAWDHNLSFGTMGGAGRLPGGGDAMAPPYGAQMPDGFQVPYGAQMPYGFQMPDGAQLPDGFQIPYGAQLPDGFQTPYGVQMPDGAMGGMGMMGRSNILVERFKANPEWEQLYEERLAELTSKLYESGAATGILTEWVTLLKTQASDLVDSATVDTEAATIAEYFTAK
jgi:spore coat protein CotH